MFLLYLFVVQKFIGEMCVVLKTIQNKQKTSHSLFLTLLMETQSL